METRAEVQVKDKEINDDLPYFTKDFIPRPKNQYETMGITKDDEMIKRIESKFTTFL